MLDDKGLPLDMPPDARRHLAAATAAWDDEDAAAGHVAAAVGTAPDALGVRIGAYKFYLYRHRLAEATAEADIILRMAARRLQIAPDWRGVMPGDADFPGATPWVRLYLQTLVALGYGLARQGHAEDGVAALEKALGLDPADPFGAGRLLAVVRCGGIEDEED